MNINNSTVLTFQEKPYVMLKSPDQPLQGNNKYEGFCIDLLNEIAKIVDFKYEIYLVPDGIYGTIDDTTGEWNGLVKELVESVRNLYQVYSIIPHNHTLLHLIPHKL